MKRALAVAAVLAFALAASGVSVVAAQDTPQPIENESDYYDNETGETNTTDWIPGDGNVTATGMLDMISRIPGMFIGGGGGVDSSGEGVDPGEEGVDPSGEGYQYILLTGLVIGAAALFATVGTGIGPVAGSMLGMVVAYGLTVVGIIPPWIQPLLLFTIVGVPASLAMLRVFRR